MIDKTKIIKNPPLQNVYKSVVHVSNFVLGYIYTMVISYLTYNNWDRIENAIYLRILNTK